MFNTALKFLLLFSVLAAIMLLGHFYQQQSVRQNSGNSCKLIDGSCSLIYQQSFIDIQLSPEAIPIEEEIQIKISLPVNLTFKSAWIEGLNMYMGTIPVLVQQQHPQAISAVSFLGSCSQAVMQWQLVIEMETIDTQQPQRVSATFTTHN